MKKLQYHWVLLLAGLFLAGCNQSEFEHEPLDDEPSPDGFSFQRKHFPKPKQPEENLATEAKFQLGRHLFYDVRLSGNQTQSCESCHLQQFAFTDGKVTPKGSTGEQLARNSQTLTNIAYNATYTWGNPLLHQIEQQLVIPIFGELPTELGVTDKNKPEILARFRHVPKYVSLFEAAFPDEADPITFPRIIDALAVFNRGLISNNAPFDRGELSPSAKRGQALFNSEKMECFHCHNGFNFSDSTVHADTKFVSRPFFNTGLYDTDRHGAYPENNTGIFEVTNEADDMGKFRPPTLRNIELTAPYMHDGSIATLDAVIDFYAAGGRNVTSGPYQGDGRYNPFKSDFVKGFSISTQEKQDLKAFLLSLTDRDFINNPRFSNPFEQEQ
ncbi:methanobactin export MATE transporter MbnM [Algicola sagamiensis]|uniref:methanobactin export MATE transporter MbnM n=1 Tax=Algicola sagamiensis TaxID=163869 RepID=UPI0003809745|nr:methanobactin export MATE transporter MbnM [Algicola sagamiensis]